MTTRKFPLWLASALTILAVALLSPALQAQQNTQPTSPVATFQKIEDQWSTSLAKQDQFTLEAILVPSFTDISSSGEVTTRDQQVAAMFETGTPRVQTIQQKVENVRIIEDVAIVDGTYAITTKLNGIQRAEQGVFTHIYQRTHGTWLCVQSQRTAYPAQADNGKKPRKKKSLF